MDRHMMSYVYNCDIYIYIIYIYILYIYKICPPLHILDGMKWPINWLPLIPRLIGCHHRGPSTISVRGVKGSTVAIGEASKPGEESRQWTTKGLNYTSWLYLSGVYIYIYIICIDVYIYIYICIAHFF